MQCWMCVDCLWGVCEGGTRECECSGNSHNAISSKQVANCPSFIQGSAASFFKHSNNLILTHLFSSVYFSSSDLFWQWTPTARQTFTVWLPSPKPDYFSSWSTLSSLILSVISPPVNLFSLLLSLFFSVSTSPSPADTCLSWGPLKLP